MNRRKVLHGAQFVIRVLHCGEGYSWVNERRRESVKVQVA